MKEASLLEVLLGLVADHIADKPEAEKEQIKAALEEAGIPFEKLVKVASWLKDLIQGIELTQSPKQVLRVFNEEEIEKLDVLTRGCILFLEHTGAVTTKMREWLIEQAMNLDTEQVSIEDLQKLLSLVLFQQYGQLNLLTDDKSLIITNPQTIH